MSWWQGWVLLSSYFCCEKPWVRKFQDIFQSWKISYLVYCFPSSHYMEFEIMWNIIKRFPATRKYYNTLNSTVLVCGFSTTHCSPQFDLWVLIHSRNAVICCICILLSFSAMAYDPPLLSFHRGWINTRIHSECLMPISQYKLVTVNAFHCFWWTAVMFQGWPKCASYGDIFLYLCLRYFAKLSAPIYTGATERWQYAVSSHHFWRTV